MPESDRADRVILDGLSEIFCQPDAFRDIESLLQAIRQVFLRVCLQKSRLHATAVEWKSLLEMSSVLRKISLSGGQLGMVALLIGCVRLILLPGLCPMRLIRSLPLPLFGMVPSSYRGFPSIGSFSQSV